MMSTLHDLIGSRGHELIGDSAVTMTILLVIAAVVFYAYLGSVISFSNPPLRPRLRERHGSVR